MISAVRAIVFAAAIVLAASALSTGLGKIGDGLRGFGTGPLEFQWQIYCLQRAEALKDAARSRQGYLNE